MKTLIAGMWFTPISHVGKLRTQSRALQCKRYKRTARANVTQGAIKCFQCWWLAITAGTGAVPWGHQLVSGESAAHQWCGLSGWGSRRGGAGPLALHGGPRFSKSQEIMAYPRLNNKCKAKIKCSSWPTDSQTKQQHSQSCMPATYLGLPDGYNLLYLQSYAGIGWSQQVYSTLTGWAGLLYPLDPTDLIHCFKDHLFSLLTFHLL